MKRDLREAVIRLERQNQRLEKHVRQHGLPKQNGKVRAQPSGNLVVTPLGDYMRSAIDPIPTDGRRQDLDTLAALAYKRQDTK